MSIQWLQVAGCCLELIGVLVIAIEWWAGHADDYYSLEKEQERQFPNLKAPERMLGEQASVLDFRKRVMKGGIAVVVAGLFFQMIGSWPGGLPSIGLMP
jgi:hypothetical protein